MAAAVALLLAGYTWLAGRFPQPNDPLPPGQTDPVTASQQKLRPLSTEGVTPLPNGGAARFREERFPDGRIQLHLEEIRRPSPSR
jgi:hypothetical protein